MEILKFTAGHMVHWVQMSIPLKTEGVDICGGNKEEVMDSWVNIRKLIILIDAINSRPGLVVNQS